MTGKIRYHVLLPKNLPGAVRDNEKYFILDMTTMRVAEGAYSFERAEQACTVLQEHANKNEHSANYVIVNREDCVIHDYYTAGE